MSDVAASEPHQVQSLYRRYRPQRFADVLGQQHVTVPLHNAVRAGTVSHAYLFSGPRGTGKTSTARILAKALNCTAPEDGEPCDRCPSCIEITRGASLDVHELDAASNNGVDAMRDLVSRAALGTPGRTKVYIVDEVHMLSTAASNALLKTLEEPPPHVVFVLATTDPQKVLPTIRSRTQHFEFRLLGPDVLVGLLRQVKDAAGLDVDDGAVDMAVRRGRGSARDALSVLDQVAAGGVTDDAGTLLAELASALGEQDPTRALVAVGRALTSGVDPQRLAGELAEHLRQAFLSAVAPELVTIPGGDQGQVEEVAARLGLAGVVRAMERLGEAQVAMRDAPDPRAHLEVALVRLTTPALDDSIAALVERVERLEQALAGGGRARVVGDLPAASSVPVAEAPSVLPAGEPSGAAAPGAPAAPGNTASGAPAPGGAAAPAGAVGDRSALTGGPAPATGVGRSATPVVAGPELARQTLGALRRRAAGGADPSAGAGSRAPGGAGERRPAAEPPPDRTPSAPQAGPVAGPEPGGAGAVSVASELPSRDELVQAWGDAVLSALPGRARARYRVGRFVAADDAAVFALPNETHRSYCEELRREVEDALSAHFGRRVPLRLVVDDDPAVPGASGFSGAADGDASAAGTATHGGGGWREGGPGDEPTPFDDEALLDPDVLRAETAPAGAAVTPEERLRQAFPGAEEV